VQRQHRSAPTTLAFHASRIVIDIGVLLAMASLSLDFVSAPETSRSALEGDALPAVLLLLPIFLITLVPDHTRPLPRPVAWGSLVLGLAAFPYAILKHLDAAVLADTLGGSVGIGARVLVFGTFVTLVGIAIGLTRSFLGLPTGGAPSRGSVVEGREPQPHPEPVPAPGGSPVTVAPAAAEGRLPEPPAPSPEAAPAPPAEKRRPAKREPETSPFGEPLFDSLEIPAFIESPPDPGPSTLIFDAETASERRAHDESDDDEH
jgi:hypothetical protein